MMPKRIHIGSLTYRVTTDKASVDAACREEGTDLYGRTHHGRLTIALDPTTTDPKQREVLLHEALHCLTEKAGITAELGAQQEEKLVDRIAPLLLDLLRTNPALVDYLRA